jgi:hypothetical protein
MDLRLTISVWIVALSSCGSGAGTPDAQQPDVQSFDANLDIGCTKRSFKSIAWPYIRTNGRTITAQDLNADGIADYIVTGGSYVYMINKGKGVIEFQNEFSAVYPTALGDVTGDNRPDLIGFRIFPEPSIEVREGLADNTFAEIPIVSQISNRIRS